MNVVPVLALSDSTYYVPFGLLGRSMHLNTLFMQVANGALTPDANPLTFVPIRTRVASIISVNEADNLVEVRIVGARRVMDARNALVVFLGTNGVLKQGTLSDLQLGLPVRLYPLPVRDALGRQKLTMIVQFSNRDIVHTPRALPTPVVPNPNPNTNPNNIPTIQFYSSSASGPESKSVVDIPVFLTSTYAQDVSVRYTVSGTATGSGVDYSLSYGELTIPAGRNTGNIRLSVFNDSAVEQDETVVINIAGANNAYIGLQNNFTYTIVDGDQPTVSFDDAYHSALESSGLTPVTVRLSSAATQDVRVKYFVTGTATSAVDYSLGSNEITILAGSTSGTINLNVIDDANSEANETMSVTLYDPTNAQIGSLATHIHTIQDND